MHLKVTISLQLLHMQYLYLVSIKPCTGLNLQSISGRICTFLPA